MTPGEAASILGPCFAAIGAVWGMLSARIAKLEAHLDDCNERWAREVRRGAALAGMPPAHDAASLPPPEWDETTAVRQQRKELELQGLRETLRRYLEDTPPRQRMPSRPR